MDDDQPEECAGCGGFHLRRVSVRVRQLAEIEFIDISPSSADDAERGNEIMRWRSENEGVTRDVSAVPSDARWLAADAS